MAGLRGRERKLVFSDYITITGGPLWLQYWILVIFYFDLGSETFHSSAVFVLVGKIRQGLLFAAPGYQALKELPQPQVLVALGLLKMNPRPMISSLKSTVVPLR